TDRAETDRAETDRAETGRAETDRTSRQSAARAPAGMSRGACDHRRRPDLLVAALALEPGEVVARDGAGRRDRTRRPGAAIGPRGRVVATEIDPDALAALARLVPAPGEAPIEVRRVAPGDPGLEPGRYDLVLLAQVDHLLADRADYLARLRAALATGGRIAVSNRLQHRADLLAAAERAGLRARAAPIDLPGQHLVILEPP